MTLVPALFNLNEPLLFAAPVVFNPHLVIPFVAAPLVLSTVTYVAVASGLVARAAFYVPSSVPTFVSTYLATLDPRAIALAALNIVLATLIYYPFVRAYERHVLSLESPQDDVRR
jgi:PTS system cellobiose-specific IIC component